MKVLSMPKTGTIPDTVQPVPDCGGATDLAWMRLVPERDGHGVAGTARSPKDPPDEVISGIRLGLVWWW